MGLAKQRHPVIIELKAKAIPVRVRQYPMSQEAWRGITPHIRCLMDAKWCQVISQVVPIPLEYPLTAGEEARGGQITDLSKTSEKSTSG